MQIVLISGLSGSGKSIALNVLEDAGYYVVDNLPAVLLPQLAAHLHGAGWRRVAVAVDMHSGASIAALPQQVEVLRSTVRDLRFIFLEARDDALIARFSETRRRHPMAVDGYTLEEAIQRERDALAIDAALSPLGIAPETRRFLPHATIARVKVADPSLVPVLRRLEGTTYGRCTVTGLKLKESTLTPRGPVYEDLLEVTW